MADYTLLEHTADLGFECRGETLSALFATAVVALSDIVARTDALSGAEEREVRARGEDDAALLRALLDEVLFRFEAEAFLPAFASVDFPSPGEARATLRGQRIDPSSHPIERVVKAVTYHGLEVEKLRRGYRARVILDL